MPDPQFKFLVGGPVEIQLPIDASNFRVAVSGARLGLWFDSVSAETSTAEMMVLQDGVGPVQADAVLLGVAELDYFGGCSLYRVN